MTLLYKLVYKDGNETGEHRLYFKVVPPPLDETPPADTSGNLGNVGQHIDHDNGGSDDFVVLPPSDDDLLVPMMDIV